MSLVGDAKKIDKVLAQEEKQDAKQVKVFLHHVRQEDEL